MQDGNFAHTWFFRSNFQFATLIRTNLKGASLWIANLSDAKLFETRSDAKINQQNITFDKAFVFDTNLPAAGFTQEQLSQMFACSGTPVPYRLTRPTHWPDQALPYDEYWNADEAWRDDQHPTPPSKSPDT